jgi:hypothetical protein
MLALSFTTETGIASIWAGLVLLFAVVVIAPVGAVHQDGYHAEHLRPCAADPSPDPITARR